MRLIPDDSTDAGGERENASRSWRQETGAQAKASLRPPDINLILDHKSAIPA